MTTETEKKTLSLDEFRNIFVENATVWFTKRAGCDPSDPNTNDAELDLTNPDSQMSMAKDTAEEAFEIMMNTLSDITSRGYDLDFDEEGFHAEEDWDEHPEYDEQTKAELTAWLDEQLGNGRKEFPVKETEKETDPAVFSSTATFVFLETPPGVPVYVSDVRKWLEEVDRLGIPDTQEVDGQLYLNYDVDIVSGERMECLECEDRSDILLTVHKCSAHDGPPPHPTLFDVE